MPWNDKAPQDRATAQVLIVFGSLVTLLSAGVFMVGATQGKLADADGFLLPLPTWILALLLLAFGLVIIVRGIVIFRSDKSPRQ